MSEQRMIYHGHTKRTKQYQQEALATIAAQIGLKVVLCKSQGTVTLERGTGNIQSVSLRQRSTKPSIEVDGETFK